MSSQDRATDEQIAGWRSRLESIGDAMADAVQDRDWWLAVDKATMVAGLTEDVLAELEAERKRGNAMASHLERIDNGLCHVGVAALPLVMNYTINSIGTKAAGPIGPFSRGSGANAESGDRYQSGKPTPGHESITERRINE